MARSEVVRWHLHVDTCNKQSSAYPTLPQELAAILRAIHVGNDDAAVRRKAQMILEHADLDNDKAIDYGGDKRMSVCMHGCMHVSPMGFQLVQVNLPPMLTPLVHLPCRVCEH